MKTSTVHISPPLNIWFAAVGIVHTDTLLAEVALKILPAMITKGRAAHVVKLPLDPPYSVEMGIALPSLQRATPATQKFISYALKGAVR